MSWKWLRDKIGITEVLNRIKWLEDSMAVDRSALVKMLAELNESGNKIANIITDLKRANDEGAQNEINRLVTELAPSADFLRALAHNPSEEAVNNGDVVPDLPPVGGETTPAQDPVTQDAVSEAQQAAGV